MNAKTLLPPNASGLERAVEGAIQDSLEAVPVPVATLWNADTCPAALLPWLAWALSIDEWDEMWTVAEQRAAVRSSYTVHSLKGTLHSLREVLRAFGHGALPAERYNGAVEYNGRYYYGTHGEAIDFEEGVEAARTRHDAAVTYNARENYGIKVGDWARYRVILKRPVTLAEGVRIRRLLDSTAPARCHLLGLNYTRAANSYDRKTRYDGVWTHGAVN